MRGPTLSWSSIGTEKYVNGFLTGKVDQWSKELKMLSVVAASQPHAAFAAFTHGMTRKWIHRSWTIPNIGHQLQALEDIIRSDFLPTLTGCSPPNNTIRKLVALPVRLGGLGIADPSLTSDSDYNDSIKATAALC